MQSERRGLIGTIAAAVVGSLLPAARVMAADSAASFPSRPVRWVVPFGAGGPADVVARTVAQALAEKWGQQVVIDNKPGANTVIGAADVIHAKPDGYTLFQPIDSTLTMNGFLFSKAPYDPLNDFTHIAVLASLPLLVVVNEKFSAQDVKGLIALGRQRPITYAFPTPGAQIAAEQFAKATGIEATPIPYKSTSDIVKAVLGGEIDVAFDGGAPYLPQIIAGRARVLAVTSAKRWSALSEVPTLSEVGVKVSPVSVWHGLSAPKGLPADIRQKIERDVCDVLTTKAVREKLLASGLDAVGTGQGEYLKLIRDDTARVGPAIKQLGIKIN